jgi:hypothetical protein
MAVYYTFGNATSAIPLSQLDNNFATPITIGNVAVQLGNTVSSIGNVTLANATVSNSTLGNVTITSVASTFPNNYLSNSTISGVSLGGNLANLTAGTNITFSSGTTYNGSTAITINASGGGGGSSISNGTSNVTVNTSGGTVTVATAGNTVATFDTSGNLGLGFTPSAWGSSYKVLQGLGGSSFAALSDRLFIGQNWYSNGASDLYVNTAAASIYKQYSGQHQWLIAPSGTAGNSITFTQAMTLDNSGNLTLGGTSTIGAVLNVYSPDNSRNCITTQVYTNGNTAISFRNQSSTAVGSITVNSSSVSFNTSSDQRLKTDLGQVTSTNVIDNTIVHDFVWKSDGAQSRGVFAQEAYKVNPSAVKVGDDGEEVEDAWSVDYSKYIPDIIVYCQQLKKRIQELESKGT